MRRAERKMIESNHAIMAASQIQAPDALSNPRIVNQAMLMPIMERREKDVSLSPNSKRIFNSSNTTGIMSNQTKSSACKIGQTDKDEISAIDAESIANANEQIKQCMISDQMYVSNNQDYKITEENLIFKSEFGGLASSDRNETKVNFFPAKSLRSNMSRK